MTVTTEELVRDARDVGLSFVDDDGDWAIDGDDDGDPVKDSIVLQLKERWPAVKLELNREIERKNNQARQQREAAKERQAGNSNATSEPTGVEFSPVPMQVFRPVKAKDLVTTFTALRAAVIYGLLRVGETLNLIASPKMGKTWLVLDLALAIATGMRWLGLFDVEQGRVLIIDNELHPETIADRLPRVAAARGIDVDAYGDRIEIAAMRGQPCDLISLRAIFDQYQPGELKLVVIDAFYRALPQGTNENDNAQMASIYNLIDSYAAKLQCAFVLIHHASKGNQSNKGITDVGSGAGAQSRAADCHLVLRQHKEPGVVVAEAVTRSWPSPEPQCLRFDFPVWTHDPSLDPTEMKPERPEKGGKIDADEAKQQGAARLREEIERLEGPFSERTLRVAAGMNPDRFAMCFPLVRDILQPSKVVGKNKATYDGWERNKENWNNRNNRNVPGVPVLGELELELGTLPKGKSSSSSSISSSSGFDWDQALADFNNTGDQ